MTDGRNSLMLQSGQNSVNSCYLVYLLEKKRKIFFLFFVDKYDQNGRKQRFQIQSITLELHCNGQNLKLLIFPKNIDQIEIFNYNICGYSQGSRKMGTANQRFWQRFLARQLKKLQKQVSTSKNDLPEMEVASQNCFKKNKKDA